MFRGPVSPRTAEHAPAERCALRGEGVEAVDLHLGNIDEVPRRNLQKRSNGATWILKKKQHKSNLTWYIYMYVCIYICVFPFWIIWIPLRNSK